MCAVLRDSPCPVEEEWKGSQKVVSNSHEINAHHWILSSRLLPVHIPRTSLRCFRHLETVFFSFLHTVKFRIWQWDLRSWAKLSVSSIYCFPFSVSAIPLHMASQKWLGKTRTSSCQKQSQLPRWKSVLSLQLLKVTVKALQGPLIAWQLDSQSKCCTLQWTLLPPLLPEIQRETESPCLHFDKMLSLRSPPCTLF